MNMKKVTAIVLAATMVMGSSLTVFAVDGTTIEGEGQNEGHVDKEEINVVLPTTADSAFDYTTDPEGLIQGTAGANSKYEDFKLPSAATDTGVYFLVGEKEFANTSETLKVTNQSAVDVTITAKVKAEASGGGKDIALATSKEGMSKTAPLYLNVKIGSTDTVVSTTESGEIKKTISGNPDNFEITYDGSKYEYGAKEGADSWYGIDILMEGAIHKDAVVADDTTAPKVQVTWSYDKAADDATPSEDQTDAGPSIKVTSAGVITITGLTAERNYSSLSVTYNDGAKTATIETSAHTWDKTQWSREDGGSLKITLSATYMNSLSGQTPTFTLTLSDKTTVKTTATIG